ncbi:MAG: hypothetical protein U9Q04_09435 [Campylobacterota bacterium]|nr:hypothetical protein [Campylobacterota bacterium]
MSSTNEQNNIKIKNKLILQWKQLRGEFFNVFEEDIKKFEKKHGENPLYDSVVKHFDKSFREINQLAESEIDLFLQNIEE